MKHHHPMTAEKRVTSSFMATMSDEVLIALIAARDKNAMHALFVRHGTRVFHFLRRLVGNAAMAEDLTSEAFIEVWRSAAGFKARSKVSTWILAVARYKAAAARRRRCCDQVDEGALAALEDPADDPEAAVQKSKCRAILQECLSQLSPPHREILDLIYYHDQSIAEVSQIIGVPQNTVKTRAFYARKRVAQLMAARGIERVCLY